MGNRRSAGRPADLAEAAREFARWRQSRRRGARIPLELWARATEMARKHGVNQTAQALGVAYYSLKERLDGARAKPKPAVQSREKKAPSAATGGFVELALGTSSVSVRCELTLEGSAGGRLRMALQGYSASELGALVREVWRQQS